MKNKQGSIMILVIFMLIIASAIGLLVMNYVNNMLRISSDFHAFNKAYYLAKGGVEFQMAKVAHREVGFQDSIDPNFVSTFDCGIGVKSNTSDRCALSGMIVSRGTLLTNEFGSTSCSAEDAYRLSGGDSIGFPLFLDNQYTEELFAEDIKVTSQFYPSITVRGAYSNSQPVGIALVKLIRNAEETKRLSPDPRDYEPRVQITTMPVNNAVTELAGASEGQSAGTNDPSEIFFFVVFNPEDSSAETIDFCLETSEEIALTHIGVNSLATYRDFTIGLEATQTVDLPGFIFSTFIQR